MAQLQRYSLYHAVEPVTTGQRVSLTLFTPKAMKKLADHHLQDLEELGFPMSDGLINAINPEVYPEDVLDESTQDVPIVPPLEPVPVPELKLD
eukprot:6484461-Amphidinium_carterae.1